MAPGRPSPSPDAAPGTQGASCLSTATAGRCYDTGPEPVAVWGTAPLALLADTIDSIENFVHVFIGVYVLLIFAYIITSWIRLPYSGWLNRIQRFLYDVCEPYLRIFRRILPSLGPLDLSPILAIVSLGIIDRLVGELLQQLR
jgi:YggT family protein